MPLRTNLSAAEAAWWDRRSEVLMQGTELMNEKPDGQTGSGVFGCMRSQSATGSSGCNNPFLQLKDVAIRLFLDTSI